MNPVRLLAAVSLLALPLLLTACGNKGPLILPPKTVPVDVPANAPPAQEIGDPSDALDAPPKADESNAESDLDEDETDPPENTDTP